MPLVHAWIAVVYIFFFVEPFYKIVYNQDGQRQSNNIHEDSYDQLIHFMNVTLAG